MTFIFFSGAFPGSFLDLAFEKVLDFLSLPFAALIYSQRHGGSPSKSFSWKFTD